MGSHDISTRSPPLVAVAMALPPDLLVAGGQFLARDAPLGFVVERVLGDLAQTTDGVAVQPAGECGHPGPGRFVHEGHELVGEPRHGAADADATHVGAPTDPVDPAPFGHVALDHRAPATELHDALGRAVLGGEVALLVVARP